jgi:acetyltransferase-like isoleucine patch superfamily enzyme
MIIDSISFRRFIYGILRFAPSIFMEKLRVSFYRKLGLKLGDNVKLAVGSMIDVWQSNVPVCLGNNIYIGESSIISGGVTIGNNVSINSNVCLVASKPSQITIGDDCLIAQNVIVRADDHGYDDPSKLIREQGKNSADITIEQDCWLGANVVILKGVHLGAHCVVGAGTIVTKSFPPYSVIVGNPGKLLKSRKT